MLRRSLLATPLLLPGLAEAQTPPLVGVMRVNARSVEQFVEVFRRDMARLGFEEGKSYRVQTLFADGDNSRLPAMAAELVKAGARIIVPFGNLGIATAQAAAPDVAVVGLADDLAGIGLVKSMARPGGNTTGVSIMGNELNPKRLEVLHELVPGARHVGIVKDDTNMVKGALDKVEAAAAKLGLRLTAVDVKTREQVEPALATLAAARVEAIQFLASPVLNGLRRVFVERVAGLRLPAMYEWPETVEEGGLASYAPRISLCYRHLAVLVAKVLKGARPADLPIEQPTVFTLALNTGTAKAIGLQIPPDLLLRADLVVD
jgi:putative ABC transport system substrate-binding protein